MTQEYAANIKKYLALAQQMWQQPDELSKEDQQFMETFEQAACLVGASAILEALNLSTQESSHVAPSIQPKKSGGMISMPNPCFPHADEEENDSSVHCMRVAAASLAQQPSLYLPICEIAQQCADKEEIVYEIPIGDEKLDLFTIFPRDQVVQPRFHDGWEILVEYPDRQPSLVKKTCLIFITFHELKNTQIHVQGKKIRICIGQ